jgi:hypothetical protein
MSCWMRFHLVCYFVAISIALISSGRADTIVLTAVQQDQSRTEIIDNATIQQDLRLKRPVSLSERRSTLKAVLHEFSVQTGVSLTIDERDPASSYLVLVECHQAPVGKMMNALYSLLSIRGGEWAWTREEKAGVYSYTFHETPGAKDRIGAYQRILRGLLSNYLDVLRQMAPMPMEERKKHRETLKKALYLEDDDEMVAFFFEDEAFWNQANFFFGALSSAQQQAVLEGNNVSVALKTLPSAVYDFYHQAYLQQDLQTRDEFGNTVPVPEPENVQIYRSDPNTSQGRLAPVIFATDRKGALTWMGSGDLEFGVRDAIKKAWVLPGDSTTDPASHMIVGATQETDDMRREREATKTYLDQLSSNLPAEFQNRPARPIALNLAYTLQQVAQGTSTPVLAILPDRPASYGSPVGKPVQQLLDRMDKHYKAYFYKWRNGALLISYPEWFTEPNAAIPFSLLRQLHPDRRGAVPVLDLARFMHQISDDQAQWFDANHNINGLRIHRPCLLYIAENPRVLQPEGIVIEDQALQYLQSISVVPKNNNLSAQAGRIRLQEEQIPNLPDIASYIRVEWYSGEPRTWKLLNRIPIPLCKGLPGQSTANAP